MKLINSIYTIGQVQESAAQAADAAGTGKFFVTVMVLSVIFIGIVAYLISIDRKIKKLEK